MDNRCLWAILIKYIASKSVRANRIHIKGSQSLFSPFTIPVAISGHKTIVKQSRNINAVRLNGNKADWHAISDGHK